MRILVTGLDGFTGRYLKSELELCGYSILGLECDLTDSRALSEEIKRTRPTAVIHLAAITFVGHGNVKAFYDVNLIGTYNLLDALVRNAPEVRSVLLVSSANIYGNRSEGVLDELVSPDPANDYAVSKCAMEQMARLWIEHLPLFIVRPFNYTGIGQDEKFLIPKIVSHFREKKNIIELGNLEVWREFGDVRTVVDIYRQLLEQCPVGKTLNVCSGQVYSLQEVVRICQEITGHNIEIQVNPKFVRANEVRVLAGDNHRLKEVVGDWSEYSLEETLTWMLG